MTTKFNSEANVLGMLNEKIDSVINSQKEFASNQKDMVKMILHIKNDINDMKVKQATYENELVNREKRLSDLEITQKELYQWKNFIRGALFVGGIILSLITSIIIAIVTFLINNMH